MRSVLCMSLSEQSAMLKGLGFRDASLRYNLQKNPVKPYCIDGLAEGDTSILLEFLGKTASEFNSSTCSLDVTGEVVARMVAEYLQVTVEKVISLEDGELLIFLRKDVTEMKKVTIYGG